MFSGGWICFRANLISRESRGRGLPWLELGQINLVGRSDRFTFTQPARLRVGRLNPSLIRIRFDSYRPKHVFLSYRPKHVFIRTRVLPFLLAPDLFLLFVRYKIPTLKLLCVVEITCNCNPNQLQMSPTAPSIVSHSIHFLPIKPGANPKPTPSPILLEQSNLMLDDTDFHCSSDTTFLLISIVRQIQLSRSLTNDFLHR